jgi:nucleoside phosphorylase
MRSHFFILAAFEPELSPLRDTLKEYSEISFHSLGIGMIEAAVTTSALLNKINHKNCSCIFVGSVGAINPETPLLSTTVISSVQLVDPVELEQESYFPSKMKKEVSADINLNNRLLESIPEARLKSAHSCLTITNSTSVASLIYQIKKTEIENLELFGVASACQMHNIPWVSLNCVTNYLEPEAHQQWQSNFQTASAITAKNLQDFFANLTAKPR